MRNVFWCVVIGMALTGSACAGPPAYNAAVMASNPVAYWRLAETNDKALVIDETDSHNGVIIGAVQLGQTDTPLPGDASLSMRFPGSAGTRVNIPYSPALNPSMTGFSVEAWAKPTGGTSFRAVLSARNIAGAGTEAGYIIYVGPADGATGDRWQFWTGGSTTQTWNFLGRNRAGYLLGPVATLNQWTHIVGTFTVTSGPDINGLYTGTQAMYINGVKTLELANLRLRPNTARDLFIGSGQNEAPDAFSWSGLIDEVAVYNRPLSASEIADHFNASADTFLGPWTAIFDGVDVAFGEGTSPGGVRLQKVSALRIRLTEPGLSFFTTPSNGAAPLETVGQTTSQFLLTNGLSVAVNASFFSPCCNDGPENKDVIGLAISEGADVSPPVITTTTAGSAVLIARNDNSAAIESTAGPADLTNIDTAVAGSWIILQNGQNQGGSHPTNYADPLNPNPRTAAGLSQDGRYMYLMTIDGRQAGYSDGTSMVETADWLRLLGAHRGLNLDGGGSTTMVQRDSVGMAAQLNRPINSNQVGRERYNGNNFGLIAPNLRCAGDADGDGDTDFGDIGFLLSAFGQFPSFADVTGDDAVTFEDIGITLANFGAPCQ